MQFYNNLLSHYWQLSLPIERIYATISLLYIFFLPEKQRLITNTITGNMFILVQCKRPQSNFMGRDNFLPVSKSYSFENKWEKTSLEDFSRMDILDIKYRIIATQWNTCMNGFSLLGLSIIIPNTPVIHGVKSDT